MGPANCQPQEVDYHLRVIVTEILMVIKNIVFPLSIDDARTAHPTEKLSIY
jgi:hypothetical protein